MSDGQNLGPGFGPRTDADDGIFLLRVVIETDGLSIGKSDDTASISRHF